MTYEQWVNIKKSNDAQDQKHTSNLGIIITYVHIPYERRF